MFSPEEKAIILCEHFKDGYLEYERELDNGFDPDENFWYGFGFEDGETLKVFDLRFCQLDGEISCTAYRCNGPDENDDYHTDASEGWCLI
tara:strand:+ start:78 stop:347 length:270 start_codon:yes stop_codon:yes gene_type:complete